MKKLKLLSLVGIISIALANAGWAAGHGGGGGGFGGGGHFGGGGGFGGGGHFGGSSFHGGAFRGGGLVTGGVGTRGGGVGFGAMHPSHGVPNFAGAGSRFSSFGRPSSRQPVYDGRPTRSMTQSGRITASREQGARPEVTRQLAQRFPSLSKHIAAQHDANWHNDWDRRHVHFDHGRFFVFVDGFWCGLDDGFFPWDYLPYYPDDYYPYDYYTNTDPNDYNGSTYNVGSTDSTTVQAAQTALMQMGYYNDSIDGVFGPSTRDAVARYQIANQLNVTGSLSPDTLASLGLPYVTPS